MSNKVIIVEGKTDKEKILDIIAEPVEILCTHGTLDREWLDEREEDLAEQEIYILVDADEAGIKLRKQLTQALPNARHLYTRKMYQEVARTPIDYLVKMLDNAHFVIAEKYRILLR